MSIHDEGTSMQYTADLAAMANVATPSSASGAGTVFLFLVEAATSRAIGGCGVLTKDDVSYDYHLHADVWPAVDAALGSRDTEEAFQVAVDLEMMDAETTADALGRAAYDLCAALTLEHWAA